MVASKPLLLLSSDYSFVNELNLLASFVLCGKFSPRLLLHFSWKYTSAEPTPPVSKTCPNIENASAGSLWDMTFMSLRPMATFKKWEALPSVVLGSWGLLKRASECVFWSQLQHLPALWVWVSPLVSLSFRFLIITFELKTSTSQGCWESENTNRERYSDG